MDNTRDNPNLLIYLGTERKRRLKEAGDRRARVQPGVRPSMTAIIIEAVDAYLETVDGQTAQGNKPITFKPAPEVRETISRARNNSGMSVDQVLNQLIVAAAMEGATA